MYNANLLEVGHLQIAERRQKSLEAYRIQEILGEAAKGPSLRQRLVAAWMGVVGGLRGTPIIPPATPPQTQPAR